MNTNPCKLIFDSNVYANLSDFLNQNAHSKIFILVDDQTKKYCLPILKNHFQKDFIVLEIKSGEKNKTIDTVQTLWQELTDLGADRKSVFINLGGGVVTDLGGFVALTFKRGIRFINIPTTLLGMVDAAIGGKTGVDLNGLKNQIGIISSPEMVLIEPSFLKTLPEREIRSGMAEVYKYSLIADIPDWRLIKESNPSQIQNEVIYAAAKVKQNIILQDPNENGLRKTLNYGHTLGHAIETLFLSKSAEEQLLHGEAIAIGTIMATYLSFLKLDFPKAYLDEITHFFIQHYPKISLNQNDIVQIFENLKHDKKNQNGQINFVLLEKIGRPIWDVKVTDDEILKAINFYLAHV